MVVIDRGALCQAVGHHMLTTPARRGPIDGVRRALVRFAAIGPVPGDALCYGLAALVTLLIICTSTLALYRQWGELAIGPYVFGALASCIVVAVVRRRSAPAHDVVPDTEEAAANARAHNSSRLSSIGTARLVIAACVFIGATLIPLTLEILWRSDGDPGSHYQPEVLTIEKGGQTVAKGKDPYHEVTNAAGQGGLPRSGPAGL